MSPFISLDASALALAQAFGKQVERIRARLAARGGKLGKSQEQTLHISLLSKFTYVFTCTRMLKR